ncbi:MAG: mechanosensitive ion channel family protein [Phycisphaerales bacterium]|nr:mechanosensitive ion channel family protein [Phycisphaerales bacterium]
MYPKTLTLALTLCIALFCSRGYGQTTPNLETPQAAVEHFITSANEEDFIAASAALNRRLLQDVAGSEAARMLSFVLSQELWINWDALPDRADGMIDEPTLNGNNPMVGKERTSIRLGDIRVNDRSVPIRVERVESASGEQIWQFSAQTVENIPQLYEAHGPGWIDRHTPDWANKRLVGGIAIWKLIIFIVALIVAPLAGYAAARLMRLLHHKFDDLDLKMLKEFDWPVGLLICTLILWLVVEFGLSLPGVIAAIADPIALVLFIGSVTFFLMRLLNVLVDNIAREAISKFHEEGSDSERRVLTQLTIARYAILLVTALVGVGVVLMQLDIARTLGVTLISSAGVAAVIFGIAGHAVLGNMIAGLQIALTQPIKLGDTVIVEDNWGTIEEIGYTFVVVNTWDHRRLVLPIKHFTEETFENWSLNNTYLVRPIYLKLDCLAPVEQIREKFIELAQAHESFDQDGDDPQVLVTDSEGDDIILRCTAGGSSTHDAWVLSCDLREQMIAYVRDLDEGKYLVRTRIELDREDGQHG